MLTQSRLNFVLILLVALCAGSTAFLTGNLLTQNFILHRNTWSDDEAAGPTSAKQISSYDFGHFLSRAEVITAIACGLSLVLAIIIILLLRRNGEYRHTLFAKAFRSSPLAITITSLSEGRYLDVNDAFLQMLDYERKEVIGRTSAEIDLWVNPEDRIKMLSQLGSSTAGRGLYTKMKTKSGDIRDTNVTAEMIDVNGVACVLAITQDVTEARRLENQLRQAHRMGAIGRLAGGVAHDFNNILTVIMGYSELASYHLGSAHGVAKHLNEIKLAAERAASLTRQLLAFSRQQVLFPRVLDLNAVVNNLMQMLLRLIGEDISLSFKPGAVGSIKADLGQIEQVLMNLVVNARDAMSQGGLIAIETSRIDLRDGWVDAHLSVRPGRYVMLTVSDTACGMDEKTLAQIFEPFFTTKGPGHGTGLGLSTVYGIVKQSDGYIWVYSEPGRGTTFKLYFPECEQPSTGGTQPALVAEIAEGAGTILVVEDDESLRKLITTLLSGAGYKVLEASDGEIAMRVVEEQQEHVDLLLTDVLMPAISGVELSTRLRTIRPDLKVLLMTGYAGDLIRRYRIADISGVMLIEKPFTRQGLLAKIRTALP